MEWTANKTAMNELVSKKKELDMEFQVMKEFGYARAQLDDDLRARVDAFQEQVTEFEQALAELDAHARYEFMFSCMLRGELADQ
jgi:hypothetical protein